MTREEIQEQYPKIAKLVWAIQPPNLEYIGLYTSKIEREGDFDKLSQWISYWAKEDCLQAVFILNKLKKIGMVEKEALKQIVLTKMTYARTLQTKFFYLLLAFLYFQEDEKVENIYRFAKYRAFRKQEKILTAHTIEEINVRLKKKLQIKQGCKDVFVNWNFNEDILKELEQIIPEEEEKRKRQILQEIIEKVKQTQELWEQEKINILKTRNALQIESQKEVLYIERNCETMIRRMQKSMQKEICQEQDLEKQETQKEINQMLEEKLENLLKITAKEEERTIKWLERMLEEEKQMEESPFSIEELVIELGKKEESLQEYWKKVLAKADSMQITPFLQRSRMAKEAIYQIYVPQYSINNKKIVKWQEFLQKASEELEKIMTDEEIHNLKNLQIQLDKIKEELREKKEETIETKQLPIKEMYQLLALVSECIYQKGKDVLDKIMLEREAISEEEYQVLQKVLKVIPIPNTLPFWEEIPNLEEQTRKLLKVAKAFENKSFVLHAYDLDFLYCSEEGKRKKVKKARREILTANEQIRNLILEKKPELENWLKEAQIQSQEIQVLLEKIEEVQQKEEKQKKTVQRDEIIGKKYYQKWLQEQIPNLSQDTKHLDMQTIQNKIIEVLLKESNYSLLFRYIHILQLCGDYDTIRHQIRRRFSLANKNANQEIIQKIVQTFIAQDETYLAFEFLKNIGVKRYFEYIPKEKTVEEYIEKLSQDNNTLTNLYIQKQLFFGKRESVSLFQCTKEWMEYLESTRTIKTTEITHEMVLILELLNKDANLLEDAFIQKKIQQLTELCREKRTSLRGEHAIFLVVDVLNQIIANATTNEEKMKQIQSLGVLNPFAYKEEELNPFRYLRDNAFSTKKIESKNLYQEWTKTVSPQNAKIAVDLYMNTHWKHIIYLETFLHMLEQKNSKDISQYFEPYTFYGFMKSAKSYFRFKIQNVNILNRIRVSIRAFENDGNLETQTYQAKLYGYSSIYHEVLVKDIQVVARRKMPEIIQEKQEQTSDSTLAELPDTLTKRDEKFYRKLEEQLELIQNLDKSIIEKLKYGSGENPFRFVNWKMLNQNNYIENQKILSKIGEIQRQLAKPIEGGKGSFLEMYRERFCEIYQRLLEENEIGEELLIDTYMNTISKYLIPLEDFIQMLAQGKEGIVDFSEWFQDYPILFKTLQDNKIQNPILFETGNLYNKEDSLCFLFIDQVKCISCNIQTYHCQTKKVYVGKIEIAKIVVASKPCIKLRQILENYMATKDFSVLMELEGFAIIPELTSRSSIEVIDNRFVLAELEALTRNIISLLLQKVEQLKKFLQLLGKNNCFLWREKYRISKYIEVKDAKQTFLAQAKMNDVTTMLYCYFHTYLKDVFNLDDLIQALLQAEKIPKEKVDQNGTVDLTEYQIQIKGTIIEQQETCLLLDCNATYHTILSPLKIRIEQENTIEKDKEIQLQIQSYNRIYHIYSCQQIPKNGYDSYTEAYVRQYITIIHRILRKNPKLKEVITLFNSEYMKSKNYAIYRRLEEKYNFQTINVMKQHAKYLNKIITQYCQTKIETGEINKDTLNDLFRIYKMGLIKYSLSLKAFLELCSPVLNTEENAIQEEIKLYINEKKEDGYVAYFPKYRTTMKAKLKELPKEEIEVSKNYRGQIASYDVREQCIILHDIRKPKVYQNTTLFTIIPEMLEEGIRIEYPKVVALQEKDIAFANKYQEILKQYNIKGYLEERKKGIQESIQKVMIDFANIEKMEEQEKKELQQLGEVFQQKIEQQAKLQEILEAGYQFAGFMLSYQDLEVDETGEIISLEPIKLEAEKWGIEISQQLQQEQMRNLNFYRPVIKKELAQMATVLFNKRRTYLDTFSFMKLLKWQLEDLKQQIEKIQSEHPEARELQELL